MQTRYSLLLLLPAILMLSACEKYEQTPVHYRTIDFVYDNMDQNGEYAERALTHLYSTLPRGFNRIDNVVLGAATDDAISSDDYSNIELLSKSRLTAVAGNPDGNWFPAYMTVRKANLFLSNIDVVPVDPVILQYWKAEARFIRAFTYFELIKRYGGVPLLGDVLYEIEDQPQIARSSYDECVKYIVDELDAIDTLLRPAPAKNADLGRVDQGVARALKSRVLLYAASPLNNPENDPMKWQAAYDAAQSAIDIGKYKLIGNFKNIFIQRQNDEVIFAFQRQQSLDLEQLNSPVGYGGQNQSNGRVSPTQNLVDAFPMKNGLPISNDTSGYDPVNPYQDRDPRLALTVFHNGSQWLNRKVETFEGGRDKPNQLQRQTRTGYYMRKFLGDFEGKSDYGQQDHNFVIFRYAEILLNFAEAANELGLTEEAYEPLKQLRKRAGIQPGDNNMYGLMEGMSQEQMREAIRLERRIELAFEEHRFWDLRRWKIAHEVAAEPLYGVKITRVDDTTFNYEEEEVFQLRFRNPDSYLYPIPYEEIAGNTAIQQNPGY